MQGGAPGTGSVIAFLGKSLPFLSMPLVMFPARFASPIKMKPQPGRERRGHGGGVLKSPKSTFRDIQLRKAFPGRGKCWFHGVFRKPLPAPVSAPAASSGRCVQTPTASCSLRQEKREEENPNLLEAQGWVLHSGASLPMQESLGKAGKLLQLFAKAEASLVGESPSSFSFYRSDPYSSSSSSFCPISFSCPLYARKPFTHPFCSLSWGMQQLVPTLL